MLAYPPMQPQPRDLNEQPTQPLDAKALGGTADLVATAPPPDINTPWAVDSSIRKFLVSLQKTLSNHI